MEESKMIVRLLRAALLCLVLSPVTAAQPARSDAVVIIYAVFPGNNAYEIGTGSFIDHDGLVLTADHIIHHISMSTPSAFMAGTASATNPTSIVIYSASLKTKILIDLTKPDSIVGGQIAPNQWMDVALIRVPLTDSQKLQIQPLDLSQSNPSQGDSLVAFGPLCTSKDENCFQPGIVNTILNSDPTKSREYQVRENVTPGYSGGPLINTSGDIVGIASWGDTITNNVITRASYLPSAYVLRFFSQRIPPPSILNAGDACTRAHPLPFLTAFDWAELSSQWVVNEDLLKVADQCTCCCESLDKVKNPVSAPHTSGSCVPPFCAEERLYGLSNQVRLALQTHSVDADTASAYRAMKLTIAQINVSQLGETKKTEIYGNIVTVFTQIANSDEVRNDASFRDAPKIALLALLKSQGIHELPQNYLAMSKLFHIQGDEVNAAASTVLGNVLTLPDATVRTQLKINPMVLRQVVQKGALADIGIVYPDI
jgi:Trypsin-like peptidase domain